MAEKRTAEEIYEQWRKRTYSFTSFCLLAGEVPCIKEEVYRVYFESKELRKDELNEHGIRVVSFTQANLDDINVTYDAANYVWRHGLSDTILYNCAAAQSAIERQNIEDSLGSDESGAATEINKGVKPFDRRLDRLEKDFFEGNIHQQIYVPFGTEFAETTTSGYLVAEDDVERMVDGDNKDKIRKLRIQELEKMRKNEFYSGVPALQNTYALIRLYGSDGGKYLMNQKKQRRWYEVDNSPMQTYNYASTPTTTALIDWGNGDPYGRTPYHFTDFVFCKYWNKIANNRMITVRRYPAPILDNLKFPGMKGGTNYGSSRTDIGGSDESVGDESVPFPPMASAVTYFGGETGNSLNNILRFSTGVLWDDAQANIWEVTTDAVPDNTSGPAGLYGGLARFAELLNVAGGNFNTEYIMNQGQLPPDPYNNGPYENRIMGPVNRIDSVKKRKPGLEFTWDGLNIVFEYVARPVGGINPKAALLDILSNFLVMGSASAVFFGGAHRFMANPAKYPFLGGSEGIEKWYKGDPIGWGLTAIKQFSGEAGSKGAGTGIASSIFKSAQAFIDQILSGEKGSLFGAITSMFTGATGNILKNEIAKKSSGQVPYLHGLKAILTGEPVGEWHITVGNPLNPIAMIGNLICEGIDVEFNEELGPDDFPTELKITVKLKHAMARDRDAIESIFNRGMGRIYTLSDSFLGTADFQTTVDKQTKEKTQTGYAPNRRLGILYKEGQDSGYMPRGQADGDTNQTHGAVSVWNRRAFSVGISENSNVVASQNQLFQSSYRAASWIAQRSML